MKKLICILAALLLLAGIASPAYASGSVFVPSVTYKPTPPVQDAILDIPEDVLDKLPEGYLEELRQQQQQPEQETEAPSDLPPEETGVREALKTCVVVTSIQEARDQTTDIFQENRDILLELYEEISHTSLIVTEEAQPETVPDATQETEAPEAMKLIFHDEEYVIREMVDVSLRRGECVENTHVHEEVLEIDGVTMSVDFDLGVAPDVDVVVLTYRDGKWTQVEKVTNNGDGTITCIFEHFCPVIFCVPASSVEPEPTEAPTVPVFAPVEPADPVPDYPLVPLIALLTAFVLFLLLIYLRRRRKEEEKNN